MSDQQPIFRCQEFKLPKAGNRPEEYEDCCRGDTTLGHFAIADGATESSFAGHWAELLVTRFVETPVREKAHWAGWLPVIQKQWCDRVDTMDLPWFAQAKSAEGAFATLLGLVLDRSGGWRAVAVGDCCLVHRSPKNGGRTAIAPVGRSADFTSTPALIGARLPPDDIARCNKEIRFDGVWSPGDEFFLMTDALSHWLLRTSEERSRPDQKDNPLRAASDAEFAERIARLRDAKKIKNDDVTLLRIQCSG